MGCKRTFGSLSITVAAASCLLAWHGAAQAACAPVRPPSVEAAAGGPAPTPEQIMARRFPQPVRVGDLIGLPVLDRWDQTLGRIQQVVRTDSGKLCLVVPFGGWFGWGARPVAVPLETVAILARQVNAMEFSRQDFESAVPWTAGTDQPLGRDETIRIALGRR